MNKRALSLILALVLVFGVLPVIAQAGELDNGLQYKFYKDYVEITGYTGTATEVVIPAQIGGFPTTTIGFEAFRDCKNLTSISFPDTITKIGISAFYGCKSLTSISIPDGVTKIGSGVFTDCENLTSISIPDSVTEIGTNAFLRCQNLTSLTIPNGVTIIGNYAFADCECLTSISIPDGVTRIGDWTFYGCKKLTNISIPDDVSEIGEYAFYGCENITDIPPLHSVTEIGISAFRNCKNLTGISIQGDVTEIKNSTFYGCENLTSITIPDSVTEIGESAFSGCKSLTCITIPYGITEIKYHTFWNCENLDSIYFKGDAPQFGEDVFWWVIATAYYPSENPTWTDSVMQNYGGRITWTPYDPNHTHEYEAVVTTPTCVEQGFTTYTCSCGESYVEDYLDALGHDYVKGSCTRCGEADPDRPENPFADVPAGSFYEEPVMWAIEKGITNGLTATEFGPNAVCNRAQVVTFLWRAAGSPDPTSTENPFVDVQSGSFYEKPVLWAVQKGITNGADATHFDPTGVCNRAQVVTFLYRAFESPAVRVEGLPFTDVPAGSWYEAPIAWAVENGITNGLTATGFGPTAACNRAQVVTFLYRAYN